MDHISRFVAATVVTLVLVSPVLTQAGPQSRPLDEDAALALLEHTLNMITFIRSGFHWIVSRKELRK
jgi:hypothetical protein